MPPSILPPAPPAKTGLARYRVLSSTAGVHVSPIALGGMSIGDKWHDFGFGSMDKESSFKLLDAYFDNGGNFIDTANNYQDGTSEQFIGEWAETRGVRDQMFIATKYSSPIKLRDSSVQQKIMYVGNSSKSLYLSVEESLRNLRTRYIDLLYVHWWDWHTGIEEVMRSLHALIMERKVLYIGASDTPAWVVAKANQFARDHGLTPFSVYQGEWNVMQRSIEREVLPMIRAEGMALVPWNVLAAGKIRSDEEEERRRATGEKGRMRWGPEWERSDKEKKVCKALEKVASEVGAKSITSVAIAYVMHKAPYIFPVIGGRKVEHMIANLEALEINLTEDHVKQLEDELEYDPGFPNWIIGNGTVPSYLLAAAGQTYQPLLRPLQAPTKQ